jgi:Rrf2 family protein
MVYIGEYYGKGPVSLRKLADSEDISMKYMEQIIPLLKSSALIKSTRGPLGGYELAKEPHKISLHDILQALQALEGSWSLVDCLDDDKLCDRTKECVTYEIWNDIQKAIYKILDSTSLADMIERHRQKMMGASVR